MTIFSDQNEPVNFDQLKFENEDQLIEQLSSWKVEFEPLDEIDNEVDPSCFMSEMAKFARQELELKKGERFDLQFRNSGYLFDIAYWVFEFTVSSEPNPLYCLVVRDHPITEFALIEKHQEYQNSDGEIIEVHLSPAHAALLDLLSFD